MKSFITCTLRKIPIIIVIESRRMRSAGHVSCMGIRNAYRVSLANPEERGPLGRHRLRLDYNIKMFLRQIG
jgi:hypothetical protein